MNLLEEMAKQKAARDAQRASELRAVHGVADTPSIMQQPTPPAEIKPVMKTSPLDGLLTKKPVLTQVAPQPVKETNVTDTTDALTAALLSAETGTAQANGAPAAKRASPLDGLLLNRARTDNGMAGAVKPTSVPLSPPPSLSGDTQGKVRIAEVKIPETATPEQRLAIEELRGQVAYLIENIDQKDAVSGVVRTIMTKLQANPDLCVFFPDTDMNAVVRGARSAYKYQARAAEQKKTKKTEKATKASALMADFNAMDFNL